jgi:hypothetical protein
MNIRRVKLEKKENASYAASLKDAIEKYSRYDNL